MRLEQSETQILRAILDALALDRRVIVWRQNTGALREDSGRVVRFGRPGQADITGMIVGSGRRIELEVKRPGQRNSFRQAVFGVEVEEAGGLYAVIHSVEEARAVIDAACRGSR